MGPRHSQFNGCTGGYSFPLGKGFLSLLLLLFCLQVFFFFGWLQTITYKNSITTPSSQKVLSQQAFKGLAKAPTISLGTVTQILQWFEVFIGGYNLPQAWSNLHVNNSNSLNVGNQILKIFQGVQYSCTTPLMVGSIPKGPTLLAVDSNSKQKCEKGAELVFLRESNLLLIKRNQVGGFWGSFSKSKRSQRGIWFLQKFRCDCVAVQISSTGVRSALFWACGTLATASYMLGIWRSSFRGLL